ncbi:hypothetical protein SDC9_134570 [bioreactor metagenome]|uniref:Uncharacterized protein n=1 Tax=bioreactor metagenome TaxID=1076179 RepID=A0A645DDI4_9ZZZZ
MWHIPLRTVNRSVLYAVETFEQFEGLLQLFENLDNDENDERWDLLARELSLFDKSKDSISLRESSVDCDLEEEYDVDSSITVQDKQNRPMEARIKW